MRVRNLVAVGILFSIFNTHTALAAKKSHRTDDRIGIIFGGNAEPAPSIGSVSLGVNVTSFLRVQGGVGSYNSSIANVPRDLANYTLVPVSYGATVGFQALLKPFAYAIAWLGDAMGKAMSTGHVRTHLTYKEYWPYPSYASWKFKHIGASSVFTYGGSAKIFVPGLALSPFGGVGLSHLESSGHPYGLPDSKTMPYYNFGLDWQSKSGLDVMAGMNICPAISYSKTCGFFGSLGYFF